MSPRVTSRSSPSFTLNPPTRNGRWQKREYEKSKLKDLGAFRMDPTCSGHPAVILSGTAGATTQKNQKMPYKMLMGIRAKRKVQLSLVRFAWHRACILTGLPPTRRCRSLWTHSGSLPSRLQRIKIPVWCRPGPSASPLPRKVRLLPPDCWNHAILPSQKYLCLLGKKQERKRDPFDPLSGSKVRGGVLHVSKRGPGGGGRRR